MLRAIRGPLRAGIVAIAAWAPGALASDPPLVLTGQDTVIVDADGYAGGWLQYYLLQAVAQVPDADAFHPDNGSVNRSASPLFPLVNDGRSRIAQLRTFQIVVGDVDRLDDQHLSRDERDRLRQRTGSVLLRRQGNVVVIAIASGGRPMLSHVSRFLDKVAGVRLYAPGDAENENLWLSRPPDHHITVGRLDELVRPAFAKATFIEYVAGRRNRLWNRINAPLSEGIDLRATHAINNYFPPQRYFDEHPELYPMSPTGQRLRPTGKTWNPCLGDPELAARVAMREVRRLMTARPDRPYLSFGVMDAHYDCRCPPCAASMAANGHDAGRLWCAFLNAVARSCRDEFPALRLTTYDYANVTTPVGVKLEPNIVVDRVTRSYKWTDEAWRTREIEALSNIAATGAGWMIHDWDFSGVTPRLYTRQWAPFLQWGARHGMIGAYIEWSPDESWYLDGAKNWVLRQLLSDPYQDHDALWRTYCRDMFGPAAEHMFAFFESFARKHVFAGDYHVPKDILSSEMVAYTPEDLTLQRSLLERSVEMTRDDPLIQRRLGHIVRYFVGHEKWALAVGEPARSHHRHTRLGQRAALNTEALAFYVNDDGARLLDAMDYYENHRTRFPDTRELNDRLGAGLAYRSNYAQALGDILDTIRRQALEGVDLDTVCAEDVASITDRAVGILRAALPEQRLPERVALIETMLRKTLWAPRAESMPVIDGDLGDPAWSDAAELTDFTIADLMLPTQQGNHTRGRIMRVGDHLVLGLECEQPGGIWAGTAAEVETGTTIWRESGVEILFGPADPTGPSDYAQYIINARGAWRGFRCAKDNRQDVHCAVALDRDRGRYLVEAALPLKVAGLYDYTRNRAFRFTVMRNVYHRDTNSSAPDERLGWHPLFFTPHNLSSRGLLFMENRSP